MTKNKKRFFKKSSNAFNNSPNNSPNNFAKNFTKKSVKNSPKKFPKKTSASDASLASSHSSYHPRRSGRLKVHPDGFGFVLSEEKGLPDIFIPRRMMNGALPEDTVLVEVLNPESPRPEGSIVDVVERRRELWLVKVLRCDAKKKQVVATLSGNAANVTIVCPDKKELRVRAGDHLLVKLPPQLVENELLGEIISVVGDDNPLVAAQSTVKARHGLSDSFAPEVLNEAEQVSKEAANEYGVVGTRVDLRKLPIITIDGLTARDFDDAVCVEKRGKDYVLWVSIADVAHYVKVESALDDEAYERGTSVYFPQEVIPMLPEVLSNDLCSLRPEEDRLTLTAEIHFDAQAKIKEVHYYESIIRSHHRGIYEEIQTLLDQPAKNLHGEPWMKSIPVMKELAQKLMKQRSLRGAIDFDLPEAKVVFLADGQISTIVKTERVFAHRLIEEFMIAANVVVAELFTALKVPALYRVHDAPDPLKLRQFFDQIRFFGLAPAPKNITDPLALSQWLEKIQGHPLASWCHFGLLRSIKSASYSPHNVGHFGLALEDYAHFTSPIRRYPDLIVHRVLKNLIAMSPQHKVSLLSGAKVKGVPEKSVKKGELYDVQSLEKIGRFTSDRERSAMEAERENFDWLKLVFAESHVGEEFNGQIRRANKYGIFVELAPHFVEGFLPVRHMSDDYYVFDEKKMSWKGKRRRKEYKIGDWIKVWVRTISVENKSIELEG